MDRTELVPYHCLEWANGRYSIVEYADVLAVELAMSVAREMSWPDVPIVNCVLWGVPGLEHLAAQELSLETEKRNFIRQVVGLVLASWTVVLLAGLLIRWLIS